MEYITCAFVNSEHPPVLEERVQGYHVELRCGFKETSKLVLYGFFLLSYPHPEAPEHATIQVLEKRELLEVTETDKEWPSVYLLLQAQKNVMVKNEL